MANVFFEIGEKHFFENIGIRNAIIGYKPNDISKILENVVYNHLLFCGYSVMVGSLNAQEVDFICEKNNNRIYVQVCYLLANESTIEREFGNLLKIADNHSKMVVSMDKFAGEGYDGVKHVYIRDFLKTKL